MANKPRTDVQRGRRRAARDRQLAHQIIDDSLLCHVAQIRNDHPIVTPTCHWRDENKLYWHGHARAFNVIGSKHDDVCINISQLDGLVLAKSAFHHSVNYRSVTLFGQPSLVTCEVEKSHQLKNFVEKVSPGRWSQLRPITEKELMVTAVAWIPIDEFSIKHRAEGANDDASDLDWPVWSGVMPIQKHLNIAEITEVSAYPLPTLPHLFQHKVYGI
ncbi:pyridoxamine 5'-phosphate oxidase family protein [Alteromonas sediminis]|uniref:Pyridoxamine 5'-phosphate oxidase family protein n=1 Tax=Alteromonas sediminis TaxID=2259342 RepID=A0A3N5Y792_9ALTE|nr:pyridoxamine 5'-phosphate oxidase family protein [Alteromonas sediminis]RPJ66589.1 pyridoxamine 5'-phosphate oxidase family protein [Alteromonas sediminis]